MENPQDEIATLTRRLCETQQRLQELTGEKGNAGDCPGGAALELHEAQHKLRLNNATQRDLAAIQASILDALPAHIVLLDHEGVITFVNEAWRRFGTENVLLSPEFCVGQNYLAVCERSSGECTAEAHASAAGIRAVLEGRRKEFVIEYPCHSPAEDRWFRLMVTPLDEYLAGAVVMHVNITERKLAERAIERALERLNEAQRIGRIGDWEWDLATQVIHWSPQVFEIVGRDPSLGPPREFEEQACLFDGPSWIRLQEKVSKALSTGEKQDYELVVLRPNGERALAQALAVPRKDEDGRVIGLYGTLQDITERKRTEARFRRLVDSNAQGVMFWKLNGEITDANDAFLRIAGYSREDLEAGRIDWKGMTPPEYADRDRRALEELATRGVCTPFEKENLRSDGARVPVLIAAATFEDSPEEGVTFVTDLTEQKELEQQFFRAQRMESVGTLAGGIAHDLNNVLSPIMMSLELLKMRFTDPTSQELVAIISASARHGADLVSQVLTFARGVEVRRVEVCVRNLVGDLEKIVNDTFFKNIEVRTPTQPGLWPILGDPTQLHQVLLNLCVNARDAMPQGGTLSISAENVTLDPHYAGMNLEAKPGPHVLLHVEDCGAGISPEVIERIFDPFFTTKEVGKGTGLGLSTSLAIVKSHGGFVRVTSEPGRGTKFQIYLPAQTEASPTAIADLEAEMPHGHGELILVVDDEASVRQITQQTLEIFGYRVVLAADGSEAVTVFARHKEEIAAVLTDMMMPVMDGPATIQVLQELDPRVPIIAASGLASQGHVARATGLGVKHFLPKPYTAETLLKLLKKVISEEL